MIQSPTRARRWAALLVLLLLAWSPRLFAYDATVAKDGTGNFTTVQAAIDAAPTGLTVPYTIYIKNGKYKELVTVPSTKPFLQLIGESVANTIITYNNSAGTIVNGTALGTQNSASVTINATDFSAVNITFENSFGEASNGGQAVAILVNNDRAAFRNCRFLGNQDTMYLKGSGTPRHYFVDCYIEGNTDFIFGSSIALFEKCNIYAKVKLTTSISYILAPNTTTGQAYGFVFKDCNVTGNPVTNGTNTYYDLARPWQANPKAAFLNCNLSTPLILAEGWSPTSSAGSATIADSYFVEYNSTHFNGRPINTSARVVSGANIGQTSSQLTAAQAATYTTANILAGWNPCAVIDCATPFVKSVVVNNFTGTKGTATTPSSFTWNTSWPIGGDVLSVYRATATPPAALGPFTVNGTRTEPNDTTFNYTYSDAIPPSGSLYKYFVRGSLTPRQISSDTVTISSAPTVLAGGSFGNFTQQLGNPSTVQSVTVSGTDLTSGITVTAPTGYQMSLSSGSGFGSSVTVAGGSSTPVFVRLNANATGTYGGNVVLTSQNATSVSLAVNGTTIPAPTVTSVLLQEWPLTRNSSGGTSGGANLQATTLDSAQVRNANLLPTSPTFKRLYLANGTAPNNPTPPITAYSTKYGQAFGADAVGNGVWTAVGGTLNRRYYEEFTVSVAAGATARIDSLVFNAAFFNTSSNTKMAIVYSKTGFTTADSTEITGVQGPGGTLTLSSSGNFSKSFPLLNQTGGPTALYRVALNGPGTGNPNGGVTLAGGQTLTIRLYFACGSTGTPRYAFLKDLRVKGDAQIPVGVLQHWPLTRNSTGGTSGGANLQATSLDSAQVRNARLLPTTPTLSQLYLSNGTQLPAVTAYSTKYGQAFATNNTGNGSWNISTLSASTYEEFTMTVASGSSARVDSLLFDAGIYLTGNGKMGILYSLDGFATSREITDGIVGTSPLAFSSSGPVTKSFAIVRSDNGPVEPANLYRIALNGISASNLTGGVVVNGGQTLTIRVYFAVGSSGIPRYAFLRDFRLKGITQASPVGDLTVSTAGQNVSGTYNNVIITGTGSATLTGPLTVNTALTVQSGGSLSTACQTITGAGTFTVAAGGTLQVCDPAGLTASGSTGAVQVAGTRSFSPAASYIYNGTAAQVTGAGLPSQVQNLGVNNANGLTLTSPLGVAGLLTLSSGPLTTNNQLTLLSAASGTAAVVRGTGSTSGNVAVQRYIDPSRNAGLGYRHYSSPVTTTTFSDLSTNGFTPQLNTAYNASATPGTITPFPNVFGYDEQRVLTATSNLSAFDKGWFVPTGSLEQGRGYTVNIAAAEKVDFVGTLSFGNVSKTLTRAASSDAGWHLLGNPYAAPLDLSTVTIPAGINSAVYVFESNGQYSGAYRSYVNGIGGVPVVPVAQGFFVRATTNGAVFPMSFSNTNASATATTTAFYRNAAGTQPLVQLTLRDDARTLADDAYVYFENGATAGFDARYDAEKLPNTTGLNLASSTGSQALAINGLPALAATTIVPLTVLAPAAGSFTLETAQLANLPAGTVVRLVDALTGTRTVLTAGSSYRFALAGTSAAGRFALEFQPAAAPLATAARALAAQVQLYPNPAAGRFHLALPLAAASQPVAVKLTNALGQTVLARTLTTAEADFDVRSLAAGVYHLHLSLGGTPVVRRVVVE